MPVDCVPVGSPPGEDAAPREKGITPIRPGDVNAARPVLPMTTISSARVNMASRVLRTDMGDPRRAWFIFARTLRERAGRLVGGTAPTPTWVVAFSSAAR